MRDAAAKDRTLYGEKNPRSLLTAANVEDARIAYSNGELSIDIARRLGVTRACVQDFIRGKTWNRAGGPIVKGRRTGEYDPTRHKQTMAYADSIRRMRRGYSQRIVAG
jgi:hypothetical protein